MGKETGGGKGRSKGKGGGNICKRGKQRRERTSRRKVVEEEIRVRLRGIRRKKWFKKRVNGGTEHHKRGMSREESEVREAESSWRNGFRRRKRGRNR